MRAFLERHFEVVDVVMVAVCGAAIFTGSHWLDRDRVLLSTLSGSRTAVYGAIIGLFGTIFGFAITATSIVLAFAESPRLAILRRSSQWLTLWAVFMRGLRVFLAVAVLALGALIFDKDARPIVLVAYAMVFAVLLGIVRLYRITWAFQKLVLIMTRPEKTDMDWRSAIEDTREVVHR